MATVPTVQGPTVSLQGVDSKAAYQSAPAALGAAGAAQAHLASLAGNAIGAYAEQQQREDLDAVTQADAQLKMAWVEQKRQVQQRVGRDAWGVTEDTKRWLDQTAEDTAKDLTPQQQKLFRRSVDQLRLSALAVAGTHEDEQRRVATSEAAQARISADINVASSNPTPLEVANARQSIAATVDRVAVLNGWMPEKTAVEKQRQLGTLHVQVLQTLVEQSPFHAQAYFDANKDEIPGAGHAELQRTIHLSTVKVQAQAFADRAVAERMPEAEAIKAIREKFSGADEDTLVTVLKGRYAEVSAARERSQTEAAEAAWGVVDRGGGWSSIPTAVQAALDPRTSIAIKSHLKEKANAQGIDRTRTDWALYAELRDQAMTDPQGFAKMNLVQYFDRLAPAQREQLLDIRTKKADGLKEARTLDSQIRTTTRELKLGSGQSTLEQRGQLEDAIRSAVDAEAKAKGKELTADERQRVIDRQIIQYNPGFFSANKRAYQLTTEERDKAKIVIPDAERKLIQQALRASGRDVTEQAILDLFKRQKGLQ